MTAMHTTKQQAAVYEDLKRVLTAIQGRVKRVLHKHRRRPTCVHKYSVGLNLRYSKVEGFLEGTPHGTSTLFENETC